MPRKKIIENEEEAVENTSQEQQVPPQTEQEKAVDEIFNDSLGQIESNEKEDDVEKKEEVVQDEEQEEIKQQEEKKEENIKEEVKDDKKEEAKQQEVKPQTEDKEKQILKEMGLTKFKNIQDALNAYKELESAFGKAQTLIQSYQKGVIPQDIKEGVEGALNIISRPRVYFEVPDPKSYTLDDGTFDIAGYLTDVLNNYTLSLQKSLVFGELASAFYTIISRAVVDKYSSLDEKIKTERQAEEIAKEIETLFPQLKTDNELSDLYEKAVLGHYQKKGQPLTREEFIEIAKKIVGLKQTPPKPKEPQPEIGGFTGQLGSSEKPETAPKSKEEQAVDEIFERALNKTDLF